VDSDIGTSLADLGPLLILLGPAYAGSSLLRLADSLQRHMLPSVLLLPAIDEYARSLQGGGLLVERHDADPRFLAHTLFALAERQATVRDLARDLIIATRYQGGVRGEMDRIHDELHLAATVQQEMLPRKLPENPLVQFGVLFRPASYVSGDIYDIVELDAEGRHVGFFIADAVGHGVPAALMTMVVSRSLRMTRMETGGPEHRNIVSPADAMTRLNEELCRSGRRESPRFTTAVYGVIDTHTRRVTIAGAGHPPPLRIRGTLLSRVDTDGPLLGIFPEEKYTEVSFTMAEDETLLLYSDGFELAFGPPESGAEAPKSSEAYLKEMSALPWPNPSHSGTAADALRFLESRLDEQAGSLHQLDDVTALAICTHRTVATQAAASLRAA
jgi:sigma-B regulation protein RsbU (phosphoserine phosphatase)